MAEPILVPTINDNLTENNLATVQFHAWMDSISEAVNNLQPLTGTASPEGSIIASPGRWFVDTSAADIYFKSSGDGDTGWLLAT